MPQAARRAETLLESPLAALLLPAWALYRPIVRARNFMYDNGLLKTYRLRAPVLSIGNLSAGGTGKTPAAAAVAERLQRLGRRPAVLSRGYRGREGRNEEADLLPCPVHCDPRRVRAGRRALAEGADCLILDDGFQHRRLQRDFDLVLIDATRPWGRQGPGPGRTLPLGLLREAPSALQRADAVLLTRCDQCTAPQLAQLLTRLRRCGKPILRSRHRPRHLRRIGGDPSSTEAPELLRGRPVVLASGIGNPDAFERSARDCAWQVGGHHRFPDHHHYSEAEARELAQQVRSRHAELVVSSKDAVKLAPLLRKLGAPAWCLEIELQLSPGDDARLDRLLGQVIADDARRSGDARSVR